MEEIKVGDYVNGDRVLDVTEDHIRIGNTYYGKDSLKIKSIVTKESFAAQENRLED